MRERREMCGADDVTYAIAHFRSVLQGLSALDAQLTGVEGFATA